MYVRDIMTTGAVTAGPEQKAADIARLIAENHINTVFILEEGRLVGEVSQHDLLRYLFPSYQEFYDDLVHSIDFQAMEERAQELSSYAARDVMRPVVLRATPDMPIMKLAAGMVMKEISCVPVVDRNEQFIGAVSRGDIFYHTVHDQLKGASPIRSSGYRRKSSKRPVLSAQVM